jgi:hypothetical protein
MANGIRNASTIISNLKYDPLKQTEMAQAQGMDNRAVSQYDKMLGKQVAAEQTRQMELDRVGSALATRRDKLAFAKKVHSERQGMAQEKFSMKEKALKDQQLYTGIEAGIGLLGVGVNTYRSIKQKAKDKRTEAKQDELIALTKKEIGMYDASAIGKTVLGPRGSATEYDIDYGY